MVRKRKKKYTDPFLNTLALLASPLAHSPKRIQEAIELHQLGQLGHAEVIYRQLLKFNPQNADALHLLGVIAHQTGHNEASVDLIDQAVVINPRDANYYFNRGNALQGLMQFEAAVASYDNAIALRLDYALAYLNRGNALEGLQQFEAAVASYDKAIELNSNYSDAYYNRGNALQVLKQFEIALVSYDKAIELKPDDVRSFVNRGIALQELRQYEAAVASYDKAIALKPDLAEAFSNRGIALQELKQFEEALASYNKAIELKPGYAEAYSNRASALQVLKQLAAALASCDKAISLRPNYAEAHHNRGIALQSLKQFEEAVVSYDKAIELKPNYAKALANRGTALLELREFDAAVASYGKAIELNPFYAEAYHNRGIALQGLKQFQASVASYDKAIALKPDYAEAFSNRGNALQELREFDQAIASYAKAIELNPAYAQAHHNLGIALQEINQIAAAVESYDKAIALKPDYEYLLGMRQHAKMYLCDWRDFEQNILELSQKIQHKEKASQCLPILALPIGLAEQRQAAEVYVADKLPFNPTLGPILKSLKKSKIRIAYFSSDFYVHPVSMLTVGLFEQHDKSKFELIAFSFSPDSNDPIRQRIENAFDKFIDAREMHDKEVAVLSRTLGVDIAIDLGGHTKNNRSGIFSFRAAPIQLSYVGYLGTMGAEYYDYLIADRTLVPTELQAFYTEKIVYLPSYQVNDNKQEISSVALTRKELNLPINGFVFCCFNANYKITPSTFEGWMRILKAVPESVMLIYTAIKIAAENLKLQAFKSGVNPERLFFVGKLNRTQYLARCRAADLFLDTSPYNAGATASDALWAGLPVLSCMGESFASRYGASLLRSIGLPELVTQTQEDYEALAIELATDQFKLKAIKDKLEGNRLTTALFNTQSFTRSIESAYLKMYERYHNDLSPDHIHISESSPSDIVLN